MVHTPGPLLYMPDIPLLPAQQVDPKTLERYQRLWPTIDIRFNRVEGFWELHDTHPSVPPVNSFVQLLQGPARTFITPEDAYGAFERAVWLMRANGSDAVAYDRGREKARNDLIEEQRRKAAEERQYHIRHEVKFRTRHRNVTRGNPSYLPEKPASVVYSLPPAKEDK